MKILYVITSLAFGGAEVLLKNTSNELIKKHEIEIIYFKSASKLKELFNKKIKITHLPLNLSLLIKLKKKIKEFQPDIIHSHLGHADLVTHILTKNSSAKVFCTLHNVYYKWNFLDKLIFFLYRNLFSLNKKLRVISISKDVKRPC